MSVPTDDEIRSKVSSAYADRVRPLLDAVDVIPVFETGCCGTDASCCGDTSTASGDACCSTTSGAEQVAITRIAELYAESDIADLPSTVTDVAFGCGNPTAIAALTPGQTVLDLGSGAGIDCFLAAKMVGETGRVYGVDMTPEMVALADRNKAKVGAANVEFRLGQIEALPVDDASIDVIISNCVINLSPDKDAVFREAYRVLRRGGRLQVSDIVWTKPVPEALKGDMEQWAGCIAGALLEEDYVAKIRAAGFEQVTSTPAEYPGGRGIASASVVAVKA